MATILLVVTPRHDAWRCCLLAEGLRAAGHAVALEFFPQAERYIGHAAFRPLIDTEGDPEEPSLALVAPVSEALRSALTERRSAGMPFQLARMVRTRRPLVAWNGEGRPERVVEAVERALAPQDLAGRRLLVTAGPTREAIDPVRFVTNPSSGRMGFAIARQATRRGARVTLVRGPGTVPAPRVHRLVEVSSAMEMASACLTHFPRVDAVVMAAAVADYRCAEVADHKIKKKPGSGLELHMVRTPDILSLLNERRTDQLLIGFAMETRDLIAHARAKLDRKGLDLIVANSLVEAGAGFGGETNRVTLVPRSGPPEPLPLMSKDDVAGRILDTLVSLRPEG